MLLTRTYAGVRRTMELRAAYERLNVAAGTAAKQARRAYLKLLKVHKPETDPIGFQEIREAWERIKAAKDWELEQLNREPEPSNDAPVDPALRAPWSAPQGIAWSLPRRSWGQQVIVARSEKTGPLHHAEETARVVSQQADWGKSRSSTVPGELGSPHTPEPLRTFYERCLKATDAERVTIAREAVAALPDHPEAHQMLHQALIMVSQMEAAAEALRVAHRAGFPGFLEPLLRQHPEHLRAEEVDEARREAGHRIDPVTVAGALLALDDPHGAVQVMRWGIDASARGARKHVPSVHVTLNFVLRLFRSQHPSAARELHDHLRRWMRDSGRETELKGSNLAATYHLTGELAGLPPSFPPAIQQALACAILDGDPSFASSDLAQWTLDATPEQAKKSADELAVYAPTLHRAVGQYFDRKTAGVYAPIPKPKLKHWDDPAGAGKRAAARAKKAHEEADRAAAAMIPQVGPSRGQWIGIGILALLVTLAIVRIVNCASRSAPVEQLPPILHQVGPSPAQLSESANEICGHTSELDARCKTARDWAAALSAGDCPLALAAKARFEAAMAAPVGKPSEVVRQGILIETAKFELESGTRIDCAAGKAAGGFSP